MNHMKMIGFKEMLIPAPQVQGLTSRRSEHSKVIADLPPFPPFEANTRNPGSMAIVQN